LYFYEQAGQKILPVFISEIQEKSLFYFTGIEVGFMYIYVNDVSLIFNYVTLSVLNVHTFVQ